MGDPDGVILSAEFIERQAGHVSLYFMNGLQDIFDA
jgi:hypothetical protein